MNILRQIFDPSADEIWRQVGGHFVQGDFSKSSQVRVHHKEWTITLDTYVKGNAVFTRMRAPFVSKDGFRFTICRKGFFSDLGKMLGMVVDEIGEPNFDDAFVIKCNDTFKLPKMFKNPRLRWMIERQPRIYLTVRDDDGWFGTPFPEGVDELYFRVPGVVKDVERLKALFDLFAEVLNQLCRIGSACEDDPWTMLSAGPGQGALPVRPTDGQVVIPFQKSGWRRAS